MCCNICNRSFCICCGSISTQTIVESYKQKLACVIFKLSIELKEKEYLELKELQNTFVLWLNNEPIPTIHDAIRKTTIILLRHTYLFSNDNK